MVSTSLPLMYVFFEVSAPRKCGVLGNFLAQCSVTNREQELHLPFYDWELTVLTCDHQVTGQYYNFSNIRFGAAPTGNSRFTAPVLPSGRNKTVNTGQTEFICPQADPAWLLTAEKYLSGVPLATLINESSSSSSSLSLSDLPTPDPKTSEDCLFLDVMVPVNIFNNQTRKQRRTERGSSNGGQYLHTCLHSFSDLK
jgi:hypothetical protein